MNTATKLRDWSCNIIISSAEQLTRTLNLYTFGFPIGFRTGKYAYEQQSKNITQYVLDTTIRKQTQIT